MTIQCNPGMSIRLNPVICIETLTCYPNLLSASEATGCSRDGIRKCITGKQNYCVSSSKSKLSWISARDAIIRYGEEFVLEHVDFGTNIIDIMGGFVRHDWK